MFDMSSVQQKHFLGFYGQELNPILQAKKAYRKKLKESNKQDNLDLERDFDKLNNEIRNYLKNPDLTRIRVKQDRSKGLGRKNLIKLRNLLFKPNLKQSPVEISLSIYDLKRSNEFNKAKIKSDSNKLQIFH